MTEPEIYEAHAELHNLRTDLANLHDWAENALNDEHDRQYIAEYLSAAAAALARGEPLPRRPF
ncbi:hypothetical protein Aab01nite_86030 [Paractinoplanes abujensis]|uniref:Uncharacterized protein n=1 Tax=Paractinoplanes abujensis TaxID=882441 RepID=A0A7W7CXM0_9ACTN|nr:hypothetical protein [Actinoplanes abujensis]MBB4695405.1 hypothetical protein [Actinoplanes abujensis]GID25013.1 hypothetical protein Aab01nite_86030 [Actinoplanes abujensis]